MELYNLIKEYSARAEADEGIDVYFFRIKLSRELTKDEINELRGKIKHHKGDMADVSVFDGGEHGYMELGAWIGDQGVALSLMGIGDILGFWKVRHPGFLPLPEELQKQMAGAGYVIITPIKEEKVVKFDDDEEFKQDLAYDVLT